MTARKVKRYDGEEGSFVEAGSGDNSGDTADVEARGEATLKEMRDAEAAKPSNFREAFAAARKSGDKTFEFNGKKFTTELASERKTAPKPAAQSSNMRTPVPEPVKPKAAEDNKPKYQSLQDRAKSYADERAKSGAGMYGTLTSAAKKAKEETDEETRRLRNRVPPSGRGVFKTSEQKFMGSGMKKGGSVGGASKRADGIAQRGKTRGRLM